MTPLARAVVDDIASPKDARRGTDNVGLWSEMSDVHCFEISEVLGVVRDLAVKLANDETQTGVMAFLPAPKTWIEFRCRDAKIFVGDKFVSEDEYDEADKILANGRRAWLLVEAPDKKTALVYDIIGPKNADFYVTDLAFGSAFMAKRYEDRLRESRIDLFHENNRKGSLVKGRHVPFENEDEYPERMEYAMIYAALALINSPRVVGRVQHAPDRHLQRRLLKAFKPQGHFPLQAWTEIKLHISPPHNASGDKPEDAHLTGMRALHFCRAYLRIRLGRLEHVQSYWAGDGSLGLKRSRYALIN